MAKQPKAPRMLTHGRVWTALERPAERAGLSPSGLAKRSGLDPTTFNKSKRITPDGRERWPSTESVAKALAATNSTIDTFVQLVCAQPGPGGYFDAGGFPAGKGGHFGALPPVDDDPAYALEISGDQMKPAY